MIYIIGVPKAGTTALSQALEQHSKIPTAKLKETHYFDDIQPSNRTQTIKNLRHFKSNYTPFFDPMFSIDASPNYFYFSDSCDAIKAFDENPKLIVVLRSPTHRAYSHFLMDKNKYGYNFGSFEDAMIWNPTENDGYYGTSLNPYRDLSRYSKYVRLWSNNFTTKNLMFIFFEEMIEQPARILHKIERFINLPHEITELPIRNEYRQARSLYLNQLIYKTGLVRTKSFLPKFVVDASKNLLNKRAKKQSIDHVRYAREFYQDEVNELRDLFKGNLPEKWSCRG